MGMGWEVKMVAVRRVLHERYVSEGLFVSSSVGTVVPLGVASGDVVRVFVFRGGRGGEAAYGGPGGTERVWGGGVFAIKMSLG